MTNFEGKVEYENSPIVADRFTECDEAAKLDARFPVLRNVPQVLHPSTDEQCKCGSWFWNKIAGHYQEIWQKQTVDGPWQGAHSTMCLQNRTSAGCSNKDCRRLDARASTGFKLRAVKKIKRSEQCHVRELEVISFIIHQNVRQYLPSMRAQSF